MVEFIACNYKQDNCVGNGKQMLLFGISIAAVIVATYAAYRYFTQGAGEDIPIVRVEEAPGIQPVGEEGQDTLPQDAQDIQNALAIYAANADIPLDTEFFKSPNFKALRERPINIPAASPSLGRVFELWQAPSASARPASVQSPQSARALR